MLRPVHLLVVLLMVVFVVASLEDPAEPVREGIEPSPNNANDLNAEASQWRYPQKLRYGGGWNRGWNKGWNKGYNGWRGGGW